MEAGKPGKAGDRYDLNSLRGLFALLLIHTIGPQTIIILPALVQGFVEQLGLTEQEAGFLASTETWGMFIATFAMMALISRVNWRLLIRISLVAMIGANVLSILTENPALLYVLRFAAGLGAGAIVAVSYAMIGLTLRKNRNFGWALFFVLLYGAVVFPVLPIIYSRFGIGGAFTFFAAFAVCGLPFVKGLPSRGRTGIEAEEDAIDLSVTLKGMAIAAMLLYFIGQIGVWSYFYRFGIRYGMTEQAVGSALSISQFFGLAGAFSVVLFSRLVRKDIILFLGIGVYGTAMQFLGIAVGPAIAAVLVTGESLANVLWMGIVFMVASIACILPPVTTEQRLRSAKSGSAQSGSGPH